MVPADAAARDAPARDAGAGGAGARDAGALDAGAGGAGARDAVPSVLAVVVAHAPGPWFAEALESLAGQDYPRLTVAVVDAAGIGLAGPVGSILPAAAVVEAHRGSGGFPAAANTALGLRDGPAFLLVCHDDVALAPDAVGTMVAEALRSNAGVVGPKLVDWDRPEVLQNVGYEVDRFGVSAGVVAEGELDQEQHDAVRDVFALPSACMLIRRDLFETLGGFDEAITFRGEDVDLCWRAQLTGARVLVAPDAVVRHRHGLVARRRIDDVRRTRVRHALRAMLVNHGRISLAVTVPLLLVMSAAEILVAAVTGRIGRIRDIFSSWTWNLARLDGVLQRRRANARIRSARPADVTALQHFGSIRVLNFMRDRLGRDSRDGLLGGARQGLLNTFRTGSARATWIAWTLVLAFLVYGSRTLIGSGVPAVGDFAAFPASAWDLIGGWWGGWSERGTGAPTSNLGGLAYLGALGWVLGGGTGLARTVWVLAPVLVGAVGAYRLLAEAGSRRAQIGALGAYAVIPLATQSVAGGSIAGLVAVAAAPWMLGALLRAGAAAPFRPPSRPLVHLGRSGVAVGAVMGLTALFLPAGAGLAAPVAAGLVAGGLVAGRPAGAVRYPVALVLALPVAALMAAPVVFDLIEAGPSWAALAGMAADGRNGSAGELSFADLLRFAVGPDEPSSLVSLLAVPAAIPLLVGRGWRLEMAVRLWMVALVSWGLALTAQRGLIPVGLPDAPVLLAPAAAALAGLCGLAVLTVEHDLRLARSAWRRVLMPATAAAVALAVLPAVPLLFDGRWGLARSHHGDALVLEAPAEVGDYRVLWIGAPEFLPVEGRPFDDGMAWAATGAAATVLDRHRPVDPGRADLLGDVIDEVASGGTARAGRLLAGFGVRYVVLLDRLAPAPFSSAAAARPAPVAVVEGFGDQLDLQRLQGTNSAVSVFVNTAWVPVRAAFVGGFDDGIDSVADLEASPLGPGAPVLDGRAASLTGPVPDGAEILVAQTPAPGWRLEVEGTRAARRDGLGWASVYVPAEGGDAVLSYSSPRARQLTQMIQVAAPLVLLGGWLRRRMDRTG